AAARGGARRGPPRAGDRRRLVHLHRRADHEQRHSQRDADLPLDLRAGSHRRVDDSSPARLAVGLGAELAGMGAGGRGCVLSGRHPARTHGRRRRAGRTALLLRSAPTIGASQVSPMSTVVEIDTPSDTVAPVAACANCGATLTGEYCQTCGQKRFSRHDLTLRHFAEHAIHEVTHLDSSKILRTLAALVFKPGWLTKEYLAGRRERYVNPIRLYLTISAVFFLFAWSALLAADGGTARIVQALQPLAEHRHIEPAALL